MGSALVDKFVGTQLSGTADVRMRFTAGRDHEPQHPSCGILLKVLFGTLKKKAGRWDSGEWQDVVPDTICTQWLQ